MQRLKSWWSRRDFLTWLSTGLGSLLAVVPIPGRESASAAGERREGSPGDPSPASPAVLSRSDGAELSLPPFVARPTSTGATINARNGRIPARAAVSYRPVGSEEEPEVRGPILASPGSFLNWELNGLQPGTRYEYRILLERLPSFWASDDVAPPSRAVAGGTATTRRPPGTSYTAVVMADSHTGSDEEGSRLVESIRETGLVPTWATLPTVAENALRDAPDFVVALGDNVAWFDSRGRAQHGRSAAETIYSLYRRRMGPITARAAHFGVVGNWEGETGKFPGWSVDLVQDVRKRYAPNPDDGTYPEGGSQRQDYFAFRWGDVLWVVLNVEGYTKPSEPDVPGRDDVATVDDWTLGQEQLSWLERTLEGSDAPFKFLCIHHAVGGNGGNQRESLYGRGGGRAASVGEQARIHALMREHGVQIFFYGHDHVFVDMVVDGIHYAIPGSCGAPWKFSSEVTGYGKYWTNSGHARVHAGPGEVQVEFVDLDGEVLHSFGVSPPST